MTHWPLLPYKLPSEPSALGVHVWRKLKYTGAILLHEAVWVQLDLPRTPKQVQWLNAERGFGKRVTWKDIGVGRMASIWRLRCRINPEAEFELIPAFEKLSADRGESWSGTVWSTTRCMPSSNGTPLDDPLIEVTQRKK